MADKTHSFNFSNGWTEIFRAGKRTSSNGVVQDYSRDDLDEVVANHSRDTTAPIVIGHPKGDAPAYGWTDQLRRVGDSLQTKYKELQPEFTAWVDKGLVKKRSVRLKRGDNGLQLIHVGYLGAQEPAINLDLSGRNYSSADAGEFFDFEMDAYTPSKTAKLFRRFREFIIDKFDVESADNIIPEYDIESLVDHATELRNQNRDERTKQSEKNNPINFNANEQGDDMPISQEKYDADMKAAAAAAEKKGREAAQSDFSASSQVLKDQLEVERKKNQLADFNAELEPLRAAGIVVPADEGILEFMQSINGAGDDDDGVFEFSSGEGADAKTVSLDKRKWFLDFTKRRGPLVDMSTSEDEGAITTVSDFSAPVNTVVDADRLALDKKARDYMRKNDGVDYISAVQIVEQGGA